jgi:hypothetical protein
MKSMEKSSSLRLEEFFLTKLNMKYISGDGNPADAIAPYNFSMDYDVARRVDDNRFFKLDFKIKAKPKKGVSGLSIDAELFGVFSFPEGTGENEMQYLVRVNGCAILYGLLRGQVAMLSGSFPCGKFNMPTIVMRDRIAAIEKKRQRAAGKKAE